jgi:hypothetical protein
MRASIARRLLPRPDTSTTSGMGHPVITTPRSPLPILADQRCRFALRRKDRKAPSASPDATHRVIQDHD